MESRQGHHRCPDCNKSQRDHQVRCVSTCKCLDSLQPQLCAHMGVVNENDFMVGGVEPNPGSDDKILYEGWPRHASRFLWPTIGATKSSLLARVKRLLKYFDPRTNGGSLVFAGVNAILSKTDNALRQRFFPRREGDFTREMHWECVKRNLDVLLPAISTLNAEAELKSMKKNPKESLLQFICRFQATMQWYDRIVIVSVGRYAYHPEGMVSSRGLGQLFSPLSMAWSSHLVIASPGLGESFYYSLVAIFDFLAGEFSPLLSSHSFLLVYHHQ